MFVLTWLHWDRRLWLQITDGAVLACTVCCALACTACLLSVCCAGFVDMDSCTLQQSGRTVLFMHAAVLPSTDAVSCVCVCVCQAVGDSQPTLYNASFFQSPKHASVEESAYACGRCCHHHHLPSSHCAAGVVTAQSVVSAHLSTAAQLWAMVV